MDALQQELKDWMHRVSIFDASYFPEEAHNKCAYLEDYLNSLVAALTTHPGRLRQDEWDKIMDDITLIHADPIQFTYMFFLMLNSIVLSALEIEMLMRTMNDLFGKNNTEEVKPNGYL